MRRVERGRKGGERVDISTGREKSESEIAPLPSKKHASPVILPKGWALAVWKGRHISYSTTPRLYRSP